MIRKVLAAALLAAFALPSTAALAQEKKWELSGNVGYKFGGSFETRRLEQDFKGSFQAGLSYGFGIGYNVNRQFQLQAVWNRQDSALDVQAPGGGPKTEAFGLNIDQVHGNFIWHFYNRNPNVKPYFLLGAGATFFSPKGVEIDGETKFSFALGGGVKYFTSDSFGLDFRARWNPTYINSSPGGIWCDPFFPFYCYQLANSHYASQFDLSAGLIFKF